MTVPSFALHDLGWHAFQQFCHTVMREVLGQEVISFLDTNDGGRDGAFVGRWSPTPESTYEGAFVAQCKHTTRPSHNLSLSDLEEELPKAERLAASGRCDVYLLMTNAGVTGDSEKRIVDELQSRGVKDVVVLGKTWLNQTVAESSRLRRLVPRLYGLGDLTQILDDRAYRQARAVLDAMRSDLDKLVLTRTYSQASRALAEHHFVLLVGAPATGKTTIAAQLALGAADEFDTAVVRIDSPKDVKERWNPDDRQLFWLDDAFGATQFDMSLAWAWARNIPLITSAIRAHSMFVLTTRDYIFRQAYNHLKVGTMPVLREAEVIVDVTDLALGEREQILYNHLRHGRQPNSFLDSIRPHLGATAAHPGFTPELARRLAEPAFTHKLKPHSRNSIVDFLDHPSDFLHEVMTGLDLDSKAALGLIFVNHDWLRSPVVLDGQDADLVARLGSSLGGVTSALEALNGSLIRHVIRDRQSGWVFSHPTMVDAYGTLLHSPEFLYHLLAGFPLDVLLRKVTCGDVDIKGAVVIPPSHFARVLDRLEERLPPGGEQWRAIELRAGFLASRCDRNFLQMWLDREPRGLEDWDEPGLMLETDPYNEVVVRLHEFGLFPELLRKRFSERLIEYCISGEDPAVVWNETLRSLLTESERARLRERIEVELLPNLGVAVRNCAQHWDGDTYPEDAVAPLRELVFHLPREYSDLEAIGEKARELDRLLDEWVANQDWDPDHDDGYPSMSATESFQSGSPNGRSVFDDLVSGRSLDGRP
jgi:hypothetical protein